MLLAACHGRDGRDPFTDSRIPPSLGPRDWPPDGWAWGLVQAGGDPPQRYGVAGPATVPRAQVLILPGYGDFAEAHYATVKALIARNFDVWVLDGNGQGGSGRAIGFRDIGHVASFDGDLAAVQTMAREVIRPGPKTPLVIVAEGAAAPVALRALQLSHPPVAGLVLIRPTAKAPLTVDLDQARWLNRVGLGVIRAPGGSGWTRDPSPLPPRSPEAIRRAWQGANPDLRMGGPSIGWLAAFHDLTQSMDAAGWKSITPRVLMLSDNGPQPPDWRTTCQSLPQCSGQGLTPGQSPDASTIAFVEGFLPKDGPRPHPLTALSNDDPQR